MRGSPLACHGAAVPTTPDFQRSLARLDPALRKLLADLKVNAPHDLRRLKPWDLVQREGVGRSLVRRLAKFMADSGVAVEGAPPQRRGALLSISFPAELAAQVEARAGAEGVSPASWVLARVREALLK